MNGRLGIAVIGVALAVVSGCGSGSESATTSTPDNGCLPADQQPKAGEKLRYERAKKVLTGKPARLIMTTSCGVLTIDLDRKLGGAIPNSVAFLASEGFYDGLTFHRVVEDFVLQGGDPEGTGAGDAGYEVVAPLPIGYRYKVGDVAMAKTAQAAPGTAGSQFFVISSPAGAEALSSSPDYGLLGHATDAESLATIDRIAGLAVPGDQFAPPSQPVWIVSATVEQ